MLPFRIIIQVKLNNKRTVIQINVLRKPKKNLRCLECICVHGEESVFLKVFESLRTHLHRKREVIED